MQQVGTMKLLAMCLGHCDYVLIPFEYINLENNNLVVIFLIFIYKTSSAISGPLLAKTCCSLLTETLVLILPSPVEASTFTASSSSVF